MQGLLLLNKPEGKSSFGAVAAVKRLTGEKRVGHTGTLDPMATGVLPVLIGRATVLSAYLLDADKRYTAEIQLGLSTDTNDITGKVLETADYSAVTEERLREVLGEFAGTQSQIPPIYSALKQNGVRLYQLARQGGTADIPARVITVFSAGLLWFNSDTGVFSVDFKVSKGTYIRALARDIGAALGCQAALSALCRTETGGFSLAQCVPLERLDGENINGLIISEENVVSYLPVVSVTEKQAVRFCNGGQLAFERLKPYEFKSGELFRVKCGERFLGIGLADTEKQQLAIGCIVNLV